MSILVTQGAGFIGSNFVLDWLAQSDEPVINPNVLTYEGNLNTSSRWKVTPATPSPKAASMTSMSSLSRLLNISAALSSILQQNPMSTAVFTLRKTSSWPTLEAPFA